MKPSVFLDTNILLDVLALRQPFYVEAARLWALAETGKMTGAISVISFNNIFYIIRKQRGQKTAHACLARMRNVFTAVPLDVDVLNRAIDAGMDDFEDAIQYFSALRGHAVCLITRNPHHFPTGTVKVLTPTEFIAAYSFK